MMDFGGKDIAGNDSELGSEDTQNLISQDTEGQPAGRERATVQAGPDNVVELPAGTSLENITVDGRDLVIQLSDGTEVVIPDGAIIVPQLEIGGVVVPAANLAALLVGNEPQPAAGAPQSSGGNFAGAVGDIQAAYGLGDLLPYTELQFPQPEEREIIPYGFSDPEIVIETPDNPGGVINAIATVDEAGLPSRTLDGIDETAGTRDTTNVETAAGTIVFSAPDGVGSVLINGVAITAVGQTFQGEYGLLTITSIDLAGGRIGFNFTLQDNLVGETVDGSFVMTVIDTDGDSATANLQIIVRDDAPIANDDNASQEVEDTPVTVDVFGNDNPGADGVQMSAIAPVEGSLSGAGELVYNGNGTFTYTPGPGEEGTVTFQYTITDGDNSTSTATVTITLLPDSTPQISILEGSDTEVDESALAFGSDPDSNGETASGALTFSTGNDSVASLVIGGVDVTFGGTVQGEFGTLVVTGNPTDGYTYVYTLTVNTDNEAGVQIDTFPVVLTDSDGDPAETTLTITIVDDQPVANPDTDSVTEDGPLIASGNVITDDEANGDNGADTLGADGATVVAVEFGGNAGTVGVPLKGAYGELKLDAEGNYTYELDNANPLVQGLDSTETLTEVFTYTLEDSDGDPSETTLTITINGADDGVTISGLNVPGGELTVDEDDLADGSSPDAAALVQSSSFTVDSPDGLETLTVGGVAVFGEGVTYPVSVGGAYGELRITGITLTKDAAGDVVSAKVDYDYELSNNTTAHSDPGQDTLVDSFAVVAFDTDGSPANAVLDVNVIDDIPEAKDNYGGSVEEGGALVGDVLSDDTAGADGFAASGAIIGVTSVNMGTSETTAVGSEYILPGEYGTLTLNKNGSYTYQSNPDSTEVDATETFTYTVIDADGDQSTATLTIDIEDVSGIVGDNDVIVNEAGLPNGSDAASDSEIDADGLITVTGVSGSLTYELTGANSDGDGQYGTLVLNGTTGQYTYTLDTPYTDGDTAENTTNTVNGAEAFTYRVLDNLGNQIGTGTIVVNIVDDVPTARVDLPLSIAEDASAPAMLSGNVLANDTLGADGARVTSVNIDGVDFNVAPAGTTFVSTANGQYSFTSTGAWTFDPATGLDQSSGDIDASFTYTLTDTDNDFSTAKQPISVTDGAGPQAGDPISLSVDDENLADGSDPNTPVTDADSIVFTPGSDAIVSVIFDDSLTALDSLGGGLAWERVSDTQIVGRDGATTIVTLDLTVLGNTATVKVTLNDNYNLHPEQGDIAADLGSVLVVATDLDGDKASASVSVSVSDDLPTLEINEIALDTLVVDESDFDTDATADFSGFFVPDYNADNPGTLDGWTLGINPGSTGLVDTESGEAVVLSLEGGVVVGRTALGGVQVFTVSVDGSGNVTLDQDRALVHADTADHDDPVRLDAANLITLSATATDSDGDFVTKTAMLGNSLTFRDDGPSIEAKAEDLDTVKLTTQDADTIGAASDTDTSSANFGNVFQIVSSDYGADDAGDIDWDFELVLLNGTSGLFSDGVAVVLSYDGDDIVGKAGGNDVFRLHVDPDSGVVTLTQYAELDHALPGDTAAPYDDQLIPLGTGLVSLQGKATITDGDDDTASDTKSIDLGGNVFFADDGPQISGAALNSTVDVDETDAGSLAGYPISDTSAAAMVSFTGDFGADGAATSNATVYTITIVGDGSTSLQTAQGDMAITLVQTSANTITGVYDVDDKTAFTVVINANGTVTLTQEVPLEHTTDGGPGPAHNDTLDLAGLIEARVTLTDGDGDSAFDTAQIGGGITFFDDGPTAENDTNSLSEDAASVGGNVLTDGTDDDFGGDGSGNPAIIDVTGFNGVDGIVNGATQGEFGTLELGDGGQYTYTLTADMQYLDNGESETDSFTYTIVDADGDTSTATLVITINGANDAPTIDSASVAVSDEGFATGNPDTVGNPSDNSNSTQFLTGNLNVADPDANDTLTVTLGTPSAGLPIKIADGSTGTTLSWATQDSGHKLVGYVSDPNDPSVVVVVADDGTFTVEILDPIYHSDTSSEDIDTFTVPVSVSDGTTTNVVPAFITVTLEDDSPVIGVFSPASTSVDNTNGATAPGTFEYSPGGDNHGEFSITYTGDPIDGVSYSTVQIDSDMDGINDGAKLTASAGGQELYTLQVNTDGTYLFTLVNAEVSVEEDISFSNLSAGGPGFRELLDDDTTPVDETGRVEFFVDDPDNDPEVNANNNNFGVGDTHLDIGEHFNMEFHNPGALGDDPAGTNAEYLSALAINVNTLKNSPGNIGPNVTLEWTATNTGTGQTETGTVLVTSTGDVLIDPTIEFNQLRIENVNTASPTDGARIQIGGVTVFKTILPSDQLLDFEISATDRDGDVTAVSDLSVLIDTSGSAMSTLGGSTLSTASTLNYSMYEPANDGLFHHDPFADLAFTARMGNRAAGISTMAAAASIFALSGGFSGTSFHAFTNGGGHHASLQVEVDSLMTAATPQMHEFAGIQQFVGEVPAFDHSTLPMSSHSMDSFMQADMGDMIARVDVADFARVYDFGGDGPSAPAFDFGSHANAAMGVASAAGMEALLLMTAGGGTPPQGSEVADAADALATIAQEASVEQVIDFFAQAEGFHGSTASGAAEGDVGMGALLDATIDVGDMAAHSAIPVDDMAMALDAIATA